MASSALEEKVHGGAYKSKFLTFDVEMQTGEFEASLHLEMEYWGGGGGASAVDSSAIATVLNGDKKTVAAATKDATPSFARSFRCSFPSRLFEDIDND
mmetsp:Transcript_21986/g.54407  ORF Transcript_21986/g.54407 Transcript_21986/m.54407 type:complete len:98 (+) Transcript_21986:2418-2711(+)